MPRRWIGECLHQFSEQGSFDSSRSNSHPFPDPHCAEDADCIYKMRFRIHYDPRKSAWNVRERGLSFEEASDFGFESALLFEDTRRDYGEVRYVAIGFLGDRLHVLCFTELTDGIRVISFRKANQREVRRYAEAQGADRQAR